MALLKGNDLLNKTQCNALRGIAIIAIFLHNFCHWVTPIAIWENEYNFNMSFSNKMWHYLTDGGIDIYLPIQLFSFFGHYGVAIFLFLSGWGLVMKYEREDSARSTSFQFIKYHWLKLFRLMLLGLIVSLILHTIYDMSYRENWFQHLVAQLMLCNNVLKHPNFNIIPGPYWFFGLMLEVYVIYRVIIFPFSNIKNQKWRWLKWFIPVTLVIWAIGIQMPLINRPTILSYLRYNAVVAMLPFTIGVLVARFGFPKIPKWTLVIIASVSLAGLMLVNFNYYAWLWGHLVVIVGATSFIMLFRSHNAKAQQRLNSTLKPLVWMGALSSCIFVVHPFVRVPFVKVVLLRQDPVSPTVYLWIALYIAVTILLACAYKYFLKLYPEPKLKTIN